LHAAAFVCVCEELWGYPHFFFLIFLPAAFVLQVGNFVVRLVNHFDDNVALMVAVAVILAELQIIHCQRPWDNKFTELEGLQHVRFY